MSRNHYYRTGEETELTDLKLDRATGQWRERFLFTKHEEGDPLSNNRVPMVVRTLIPVPKGRDKDWYKQRAERNARALGFTTVSFNWGIQAPKEARQPIPNVVSDKRARKAARAAARNNPAQYTKGGSPAAHARYKITRAKDESSSTL